MAAWAVWSKDAILRTPLEETTMKFAVCLMLSVAVLFGFVAGATAAEKTLKGTITCPKCDLQLEDAKKCWTLIKVKEDGKDVLYYFDKEANTKHHGKICKEAKKGTVTGTISEK